MFARALEGCHGFYVMDDYNRVKKFAADVLARQDAEEYISKKRHEHGENIEAFERYKSNEWIWGQY